MRKPVASGSPIVVKVGSSSLTGESGQIDTASIDRVVAQIEALRDGGHPVVLVTSGAVAAGLPALGRTDRPSGAIDLQVAAAVGQGRLMQMYTSAFERVGRVVGQVLMTRDVLARREQYLHARSALERMMGLGVLPIVNENDTVVVDEISLGDNDRLAAIVGHLVGAGMLILLSDTPGLFAQDPAFAEQPELLDAVRHTDEVLDSIGTARAGSFGTGGVGSKVAAARIAAWSGIPTVVASSNEESAALHATQGGEVGTWVQPQESGLSARKLWIGFGLPAAGEIKIDTGAREAVAGSGKSLLAVGITEVEGRFESSSAVQVTCQGDLVAKGLVRLDADEIRSSKGRHSSIAGGVVIHRDDMVVLV